MLRTVGKWLFVAFVVWLVLYNTPVASDILHRGLDVIGHAFAKGADFLASL
jgi:hypothetical protein